MLSRILLSIVLLLSIPAAGQSVPGAPTGSVSSRTITRDAAGRSDPIPDFSPNKRVTVWDLSDASAGFGSGTGFTYTTGAFPTPAPTGQTMGGVGLLPTGSNVFGTIKANTLGNYANGFQPFTWGSAQLLGVLVYFNSDPPTSSNVQLTFYADSSDYEQATLSYTSSPWKAGWNFLVVAPSDPGLNAGGYQPSLAWYSQGTVTAGSTITYAGVTYNTLAGGDTFYLAEMFYYTGPVAKPGVVITTDGGYASTLSQALPIAKADGLLITSSMGGQTMLQSPSSVANFLAAGLDIIPQAYEHIDYPLYLDATSATCNVTGSISGTNLIITSTSPCGNNLASGQLVQGAVGSFSQASGNVIYGTTIVGPVSGITGGAATYTVNISQTVASQTLTITDLPRDIQRGNLIAQKFGITSADHLLPSCCMTYPYNDSNAATRTVGLAAGALFQRERSKWLSYFTEYGPGDGDLTMGSQALDLNSCAQILNFVKGAVLYGGVVAVHFHDISAGGTCAGGGDGTHTYINDMTTEFGYFQSYGLLSVTPRQMYNAAKALLQSK